MGHLIEQIDEVLMSASPATAALVPASQLLRLLRECSSLRPFWDVWSRVLSEAERAQGALWLPTEAACSDALVEQMVGAAAGEEGGAGHTALRKLLKANGVEPLLARHVAASAGS